MKVTDLTASKVFQPITLEIEVENDVDLKYLWLITNIGYTQLTKAYSGDEKCLEQLDTIYTEFGATNKYDLWHILDKHMKRMGPK